MSHAQHWPALNSTASRLKIFLLILVGVACVSVMTYYWRTAAGAAMASNASLLPARTPPRLSYSKFVPPALVSTNSQVGDDSLAREAEFLVFMGDEMFQRGDVEGAAQAFQKALEQDPVSEQIHLKLALCFSRLHRPGEALAMLQEAIHIAPDFAEAHHQAGLVLMKQGNFRDAADHFAELTRLKPQQASAYNGLGLALARMGKLPLAATHFAAAARLNPRYLEARFNLAQVQAQLGQRTEAAAELDRLLQLNPQFQAARVAREQLEQSALARSAQR